MLHRLFTTISLCALLAACGTNEVQFGSGGADASGGSGATGAQGGSGGSGTGVTGGGGTGGSPTGAGGTMASCGDGVIDGDEDCDGDELGGQDCTALGYGTPGDLGCQADCTFDDGGCEASCDGALLEPGEDCDGADLGGVDCTAFGYSEPAGLSCTQTCAFDDSGCEASCDGALLEPGEDCDGADLGGGDCTAFGYVNPAGLSCTDGCEHDPEGCTAVCGNMQVEPGEDCDDMSATCINCQQGGGTSCADAIAVVLSSGSQTFTGSTVGGGFHQTDQCQNEGQAPDRVYEVTVTSAGFLTASLTRPATDYDAILYALSNCISPSSGIWCADAWDPNDSNATGGDVISFEVAAGSTVTIVVDGFNGDTGNYELVLDHSVGTCADPVPFPVWSGVPMNAIGSTSGKPNSDSSIGCGGAQSGEVVYEIQPQLTGNVELRLPNQNTPYAASLYARSTCSDATSQLDCDADINTNNDEVIDVGASQGTPFYGFVDGFSGAEGNYRLRIAP